MTTFRRVVFDTSTLVSAALRVGSTPHFALARAWETCEVCASQETLAELDKVLARAKFDRYQPRDARKAFISILRHSASVFAVSAVDVANVSPPCRDPQDNLFLALAGVCDADVLVSSDADLLVLHPWNGVPIMAPSAFMDLQRDRP